MTKGWVQRNPIEQREIRGGDRGMSLLKEQQQKIQEGILIDPRGDEAEKLGRFDEAEGKTSRNDFTEGALAKKQEQQALLKVQGGAIDADQTAYAISSKAAGGLDGTSKDKKKKKEDNHSLLLQLNSMHRRLQELEEERFALNRLREMVENGELDEKNDAHRQMLIERGLDPDKFFKMSKKEQLEVLDQRIEQNKQEEIDLKPQTEDLENRMGEAENSRDTFRSHYSDDEIAAAFREEEIITDSQYVEPIDLESEIEKFMQAHSKAMADNDMKSLEKAVEDLPDEAKEMFVDTEYEELFNEGYFDQFNSNASESTPANIQPQAAETYTV